MAHGWTRDIKTTPEEFWKRQRRRRRVWLGMAMMLIVLGVVGLLELMP